MAEAQDRKKRQVREGRLAIVAEMYKKGASFSKIIEEVKIRTGVKTCSRGTIHNDVQKLLKEWREERLEDVDMAVQLELQRIDDAVQELWTAWEKSKTDHTLTRQRKKGQLGAKGDSEGKDAKAKNVTTQVEKTEIQTINHGDPRYISEIRAQLAERRKLLGLYQPEKRELYGGFIGYLMQAGVINDDNPEQPQEHDS